MHTIINKKDYRYSENDQVNPLRWRLLFKNEDSTFEDQTGLIKCRDFFNDVVASLYGKLFAIYGFKNDRVKFNDEGLYIELSNLCDSTKLAQSIEKAIEPTAIKQLGEEAKLKYIITSPKTAIICIPKIFFKQTYTISILTMLIRECNFDCVKESWDELFKDFRESWTSRIKEYIFKNGFLSPTDTRSFWYYYTSVENSNSGSGSIYTIHNCGVTSWLHGAGFKE